MGNITLSFSNSRKNINLQKNNVQPKNNQTKVTLTYHDCVVEQPEYYTYINSNGQEEIFTDKSYAINKVSSSQYIAKKSFVTKVGLDFVKAKSPVKYQKEYFTYNNNEKYLDKVNYNAYTNSYFGTLEFVEVHDKEILLYEE